MHTTKAIIRLACNADVSDVRSCAQAAYAQYVDLIGQKPAPMVADFSNQIERGQLYVAALDSSVVGYVVFYPEQNHLHLESIAVLPSFSGKGIGKKLIEFVENYACKNSFSAIELYTNESMAENLVMYPKLGYVETSRKNDGGFNRVFFCKVIS